MVASLKVLKQNKLKASDVVIFTILMPVIIQAGIIVGITFYGFGMALLTSLNVI